MKTANKFSLIGIFLIVVGFTSLVIRWFSYVPNFNLEMLSFISMAVIFSVAGVMFLVWPYIKEGGQWHHMAFHDPLTGVGNRNKLKHYLSKVLATSSRKHENFAIILLDLDRFKNINDSIGHDAGDALLQIVAERLQNSVRSSDMVARLGGDEFMVVITDAKSSDAVADIAQKILDNVLKKMNIQGHEIYTTTSIGICMYPHDGQDTQTLIKNADLALYRAKEVGRNNFQFCTPEMTYKAQEKYMQQTALHHAMIKEEFILFYQPAIDVVTKRINNVEALLRWPNKDYSFVTPDSIIQLAEESGLIVPLSEWVLRTACKKILEWHKAGYPELTLSINVSARHFKQADFIDKVAIILKETGFPTQSLILDVTESLIMADPAHAQVTLSVLRDMGIKVVIDHFGTGYSSFSYLRNFPVDKIKIDKAFILPITKDPASIALISAMVAMATKLNIKTVVEGVETKEQFDLLVKEGCAEVQGFYIAKPMAAENLLPFLQQSKTVSY